MPFYTYILFSKIRNTYYVGHIGDGLFERLRKHNSNHKCYTGKPVIGKLYSKNHLQQKQKLMDGKGKFKSWKSRKRIEQLIGSEHSA